MKLGKNIKDIGAKIDFNSYFNYFGKINFGLMLVSSTITTIEIEINYKLRDEIRI
jgi:hypothetical protein